MRPLVCWDRGFEIHWKHWIFVCRFCCVLSKQWTLRRADHSLRGVIPGECVCDTAASTQRPSAVHNSLHSGCVLCALADPSGRAFFGLSLAGVALSSPVGRMDVCLLRMCAVRQRSLRPADHLSIGALPNVACLSVIVKLRKWGGHGSLGAVAPWVGGWVYDAYLWGDKCDCIAVAVSLNKKWSTTGLCLFVCIWTFFAAL